MKKLLFFIMLTMAHGAFAGIGGPKGVDSIIFTRDGTTQTTAATSSSASGPGGAVQISSSGALNNVSNFFYSTSTSMLYVSSAVIANATYYANGITFPISPNIVGLNSVNIGDSGSTNLDVGNTFATWGSGLVDLRKGGFATWTISNATLQWPSTTPDVLINKSTTNVVGITNGSTAGGGLKVGTIYLSSSTNSGSLGSVTITYSTITSRIEIGSHTAITGSLNISSNVTSVKYFASTGSATALSYGFVGDNLVGIFNPSPGNMAFMGNGSTCATTGNYFNATNRGFSSNMAGTAALPVYTWGSDLNTGLLNPTADNLAISAGGIIASTFTATDTFIQELIVASSVTAQAVIISSYPVGAALFGTRAGGTLTGVYFGSQNDTYIGYPISAQPSFGTRSSGSDFYTPLAITQGGINGASSPLKIASTSDFVGAISSISYSGITFQDYDGGTARQWNAYAGLVISTKTVPVNPTAAFQIGNGSIHDISSQVPYLSINFSTSSDIGRIDILSGTVTQRLGGNLFTMVQSSVSANTTAETNLVRVLSTQTITIPAIFWQSGKSIAIKGAGFYSSTTTTPGNFTLKFKIGSTVILTTATVSYVASQSTQTFAFSTTLACRATGSSGSLMGQTVFGVYDTTNGFRALPAINTIPVTIDLSIDNAVSFTWQDSVASVLNTKTLTNFTVDSR